MNRNEANQPAEHYGMLKFLLSSMPLPFLMLRIFIISSLNVARFLDAQNWYRWQPPSPILISFSFAFNSRNSVYAITKNFSSKAESRTTILEKCFKKRHEKTLLGTMLCRFITESIGCSSVLYEARMQSYLFVREKLQFSQSKSYCSISWYIFFTNASFSFNLIDIRHSDKEISCAHPLGRKPFPGRGNFMNTSVSSLSQLF